MRKCVLLPVSGLLLSGFAVGAQLDVGINNDAFNLDVSTSIAPTAEIFAAYHYEVDDGQIAELGIKTSHTVDIHTFSVGAKGMKYWAKQRDDSHLLALGGDYTIQVAPKLSLAASAYYSPNVLSSSKLDSYYDYSLKAQYHLMPTADLYLGYQDKYFEYENQGNLHYNKGFFIGASVHF